MELSALSAEIRAIRAYMQSTGVPHRATSTWRDQPGSFHHTGQAVDFAGPKPSRNSPQLLDVYEALLALAPVAEELFYGGPGGALWRDGRRFSHERLREQHEDHVHIAVRKGWRWTPPAPTPPARKVEPMYDPPLGPIAAVWQDENGRVLAGVSPEGDVYAWAIPWAGNVRGKPYWGDRKAARIGARDDGQPGYQITATDGAHYRLPDGIDQL